MSRGPNVTRTILTASRAGGITAETRAEVIRLRCPALVAFKDPQPANPSLTVLETARNRCVALRLADRVPGLSGRPAEGRQACRTCCRLPRAQSAGPQGLLGWRAWELKGRIWHLANFPGAKGDAAAPSQAPTRMTVTDWPQPKGVGTECAVNPWQRTAAAAIQQLPDARWTSARLRSVTWGTGVENAALATPTAAPWKSNS